MTWNTETGAFSYMSGVVVPGMVSLSAARVIMVSTAQTKLGSVGMCVSAFFRALQVGGDRARYKEICARRVELGIWFGRFGCEIESQALRSSLMRSQARVYVVWESLESL